MDGRNIPEFLPGDIILCPRRGEGDWLGQIIRWMEQTFGEGPTYATHAAQFLDGKTVLEMDFIAQVRTLRRFLKGRTAFEVWRCTSLTAEQRQAISLRARAYVNTKFGAAKFFTHFLDGLINRVTRKEVFFFRRLNHADRYPICSWITAFSYYRALDYSFGVTPECANPDQIHDWVREHPAEWVRVFCLEEYLQTVKQSASMQHILS